MNEQHTIRVTILFENPFWIGLFERVDKKHHAVARQVFGAEPTDAELYAFVSEYFYDLKFTEPQKFNLIIKRKNPKRLKREVKREMKEVKKGLSKTSFSQEVLRIELEKNKKNKKKISKIEKEESIEKKFKLKQEKRKQKHKGH